MGDESKENHEALRKSRLLAGPFLHHSPKILILPTGCVLAHLSAEVTRSASAAPRSPRSTAVCSAPRRSATSLHHHKVHLNIAHRLWCLVYAHSRPELALGKGEPSCPADRSALYHFRPHQYLQHKHNECSSWIIFFFFFFLQSSPPSGSLSTNPELVGPDNVFHLRIFHHQLRRGQVTKPAAKGTIRDLPEKHLTIVFITELTRDYKVLHSLKLRPAQEETLHNCISSCWPFLIFNTESA